ncbi:siphovirus ReqiPepy6 Gp37-like family protein [Streptomyces mexicanus]|uniref:siphovirus ReqiPepy6 Gp37-like family protein n=1 Tax=Streptomyces mexicanus TaxID=178566 RepID=UPI00365861ED
MAITLLVTDKNLKIVGDPLDDWLSLDVTRNFNAPASGSVDLPAHPATMSLLQPGNRLVVIRDGQIWCAGPLEEPQSFEWSVDGEQEPGKVTCNFSDDLARIAGYLTYPNPNQPFASQLAAADMQRVFVGSSAETIIRTLVSENCGPTALVSRQIQRLVLDDVASVGSPRSLSTRFEPLLDACRAVAVPDGLGFRTRQVGNQIKFGVYKPIDRTSTARFSTGLGNLRSVRFTMSAPTATSELVQGGDAGSRAYVEVTNAAAASDWYRVEKLVDQSGKTDTNGELTQAGQLELGTDNPQASLATVTVDTDDLKAGRDFDLGDLVTVQLPTGLDVADIVQSIHLTATPSDGEQVTSVVGTSDQTTSTATVRVVRDLARRLGRLETR